MKKNVLRIFTVLLLIVLSLSISACAPKEQSQSDLIIITIQADKYEENDTLKDYMARMQEKGEITFTLSDGMITDVNGKKGGLNKYWMVYTDDAENSNNAWGEYVYEEKTYGSAAWGIEQLKIKVDCTYIICLQAF